MCAAADLSDCRLVCSITPAGVDVKGGGKAAVHRSAAYSGAQTLDVRLRRCYSGYASGKIDGQLCVDHAPVRDTEYINADAALKDFIAVESSVRYVFYCSFRHNLCSV